MPEEFKRHIAYKLKIGDIQKGSVVLDGERFKFLNVGDKQAARVNVVANIIDKFIQNDEKKFGSITLDDATGQIKVKAFGEDTEKFSGFERGDTVMLIGLLRHWNNEIYITPEIIKKKDAVYLMLRKLETDIEKQKTPENLTELKDKIVSIIKREEERDGVEITSIITELNAKQESVKQEIKKLLEDGTIYEPRPGKVRYLG